MSVSSATMLAGAGGIDLALLVVAADEGVMPQTREHLGILSLLRYPRGGVIVVTKCDLVEEDLYRPCRRGRPRPCRRFFPRGCTDDPDIGDDRERHRRIATDII